MRRMTCETCNGRLVRQEDGSLKCAFCGNTYSDPLYELPNNAENIGYNFERGRIRAHDERYRPRNNYSGNTSNPSSNLGLLFWLGAIALAFIVIPFFLSLLFNNAGQSSSRGTRRGIPTPTTYTTSYETFEALEETNPAPSEVSLEDMTPYTWTTNAPNTSNPFWFLDDYEDVFGTNYDKQMMLESYNCQYGNNSTSYRLFGEYSTFTFVSGASGFSRGYNTDYTGGSITIIGDGRILYIRQGMSSISESEEVSLNIRGVDNLTIEMSGDYQTEISLIGFSSFSPALFNPILHR